MRPNFHVKDLTFNTPNLRWAREKTPESDSPLVIMIIIPTFSSFQFVRNLNWLVLGNPVYR